MNNFDLEILEQKMKILGRFVEVLRKQPQITNNLVLADAVAEVLRTCGSEDIEKAFDMCEIKYGEMYESK